MAKITKKTMRAAQVAERRTVRQLRGRTGDNFQNFALNLGLGTDNALSGSTYGFNPITRNRTLLEWIHRGSWLGGVAVDTVAEDMTRAGIEITCDAEPEQTDGVQQDLVSLGVWDGICDTSKWSRLYGGAIGVVMIDGQDYSTPLDPDKVGRNQFRGVVSLDRWMIEPSLNDLVSEQGPQLGLPKFYRVTSDIPGLRMKIVHHSRVIRFDGIRLPYWQRVSENLWGISVLERLYDRMVAFDSATTGAAQLAYKSYLRVVRVKGLREILAAGGPAEAVLASYFDMMRRFQGIEGLTVLDQEDEFAPHSAVNMSGMSEALLQFGQQLSGALQIPLVRLFGQSPAGLNSTGESDLRTYYDGIAQQQNRSLLVPMKAIVRCASLSGRWDLPDDFSIKFRPLWQLSEEQKAEVANRDTETVLRAEERGVISQQTALKELKQQSITTNRWTNITDADIEAASDELAPRGEEALKQDQDAMRLESELGGDDQDRNDPEDQRDSFDTKDSLPYSQICGLDVAVENPRGSIRRGRDEQGRPWETVMPADYGYIRRAPSAEGATEWLDCFVGPVRTPDCPVHVIDGYDPDGNFDEHKVMLGFQSRRRALECYHNAYGDGRRAGDCTTMTADELRRWFQTGDVTRPIGARNLRLAATGAV